MFKFDFDVADSCNNEEIFRCNNPDDNINKESESSENSLKCYESLKVIPTVDVIANYELFKVNSTDIPVGNVIIQHIKSGNLIQAFAKDNSVEDIQKAEMNHSDLLPGIYEGGAKIWECTDDVLAYMAANFEAKYLEKKRVLDLGCGAGLLGIYAMKQGAFVQFQDYNKDVLETITMPNVLLNKSTQDLNAFEGTEFYAGDWNKYVKLTKDHAKFNLILSAETIYNPSNYKKLLDTLEAKLSSDGIVLLAAKIHYFGIGGGLRQFELVLEEYKKFETKVLWSSTEGVRREILEIKFK